MKMLVSDFDGTLYNKDYQQNIDAINRFVEKGNLFVIATGRDLNNLLKDLDKNLKFNYLICSDGSIIYDADFNEIYRNDIDSSVVSGICHVLDVNDCFGPVNILNGASLNTSKVNAIYAPYDANKIEMAKYALDYIQVRFPHVRAYLSDHYINITNRKVNKGTGIQDLIKIEHLDTPLIYTIGDDLNDKEMLLKFIGCAMVNHKLDFALPTVCSVEQLVRILM